MHCPRWAFLPGITLDRRSAGLGFFSFGKKQPAEQPAAPQDGVPSGAFVPQPEKAKKFFEFDCPGCNANNPWGDGFEDGEEINCHYCGSSFIATVSDEGRLKLKEI